jgi:GTP cyclohydrolase I
MDSERIEHLILELLRATGANIDDEGLIDTPRRAAGFLMDRLRFQNIPNSEIAKRFGKVFPVTADGPVIARGIPIFSLCEHHIALMFDMSVDVAYLPDKKVLGLSKITRIADAASRRLQLQERLTDDIADIIQQAAKPLAVLVRIRGRHSCIEARGIERKSITYTEASRGEPEDIVRLREVLRECPQSN